MRLVKVPPNDVIYMWTNQRVASVLPRKGVCLESQGNIQYLVHFQNLSSIYEEEWIHNNL